MAFSSLQAKRWCTMPLFQEEEEEEEEKEKKKKKKKKEEEDKRKGKGKSTDNPKCRPKSALQNRSTT